MTPLEQIIAAVLERAAGCAQVSRDVFSGCCDHTHQAIDYLEQVIRAIPAADLARELAHLMPGAAQGPWTGMGLGPAPKADPACQCVCHTQPGVQHIAACCTAPATGDEPVAWVIPGSDIENVNGFIDAMGFEHGEFTRPLYTHPSDAESLRDEVDRLTLAHNKAADDLMRAGMLRITAEAERDAALARVKELEAQIAVWMTNSRDTFNAMCAMRDAINEHIPMPSLESDLLQGPENSVFCAVVAEAVIAALTPPPDAGLDAAIREAIDLLTERKRGSPARSASHNARLVLETAFRARKGGA